MAESEGLPTPRALAAARCIGCLPARRGRVSGDACWRSARMSGRRVEPVGELRTGTGASPHELHPELSNRLTNWTRSNTCNREVVKSIAELLPRVRSRHTGTKNVFGDLKEGESTSLFASCAGFEPGTQCPWFRGRRHRDAVPPFPQNSLG